MALQVLRSPPGNHPAAVPEDDVGHHTAVDIVVVVVDAHSLVRSFVRLIDRSIGRSVGRSVGRSFVVSLSKCSQFNPKLAKRRRGLSHARRFMLYSHTYSRAAVKGRRIAHKHCQSRNRLTASFAKPDVRTGCQNNADLRMAVGSILGK